MIKSKINSKKKAIILISLFAISAIVFLNIQVKDVNADSTETDIPVYPYIDPNNEWHWHADIFNGTEYVYETTFIARNKTTDEFLWTTPTRFNFIFNISISNATIQWHGDKPCYFSVINATELYYDSEEKKTVAYPMESITLGGFQYNATGDQDDTEPIEMRSKERFLHYERIPIPFFLPINGSHGENIDNEDIDVLANIINKTIFYPYYARGIYEGYGYPFMNLWNNIEVSSPTLETKAILFTNSSGYKCELVYYLNGTLKYGDLYAELLGGNPEIGHPEVLTIVNITFNRIFDPNPINEVQWDVKEGDIFYYGKNDRLEDTGTSYSEVYVNITGFVNGTEIDEYRRFSFCLLYEGDPQITYQAVIGRSYVWNSTTKKYEKEKERFFGYATDYMPYPGPIIPETEIEGDIIPSTAKEEDFLFWTKRWFILMSGGDYSFTFEHHSNGFNWYKFEGKIGSGNEATDVLAWYDMSKGVIARLEHTDPQNNEWSKLFMKDNYTLNDGFNEINLKRKFFGGIPNNIAFASANITTNGGDSDLVISLLPSSPVNESLPSSVTPLVYIDWLITNPSTLTYINITIELYNLNLNNINIQLWDWNMTKEYDWTPIAADIYSQVVSLNYAKNSITINIPTDEIADLQEFTLAISYSVKSSAPPSGDDDDDDDDNKPTAIPGFDLWVIFGLIALISLIAVLKKRKFVV